MTTVDVDGSSLPKESQDKSVGLVGGLVAIALSLHSSNEPGELSQWLLCDDSAINAVVVIIMSHRSSSYVAYCYR